MRTPMSNCLIFLEVIVKTYDLLCASCVSSEHLVLIQRYLSLIESQLLLTLSFVNDLLDLRCIKDGVFAQVAD